MEALLAVKENKIGPEKNVDIHYFLAIRTILTEKVDENLNFIITKKRATLKR